jgi:CDP-paratose 2-epimerase
MKRLKILITGGCGFIGCNAAFRFHESGHKVALLDNLSRPCTDLNLEWLREQGRIEFIRADVRDPRRISDALRNGGFDVVIHLAAQVAVTTSVKDPANDFEVNAAGTINVLEGIRRYSPETIFLNASTNKVYGKLQRVAVRETATRYRFSNGCVGISELQPLDFHSPYGCSKGAADQYTLDYARIYGLRTVNFRQSCIYGPHQFGVEDQGWVAWFTIAHEMGKPITIYGTGKQVRDLLSVDDLVTCYLKSIERIDRVAGMSFNIGGGLENALSIVEFLDLLSDLSGRKVNFKKADWRPGDQPVYVSDNARAKKYLGWQPKIHVRAGIEMLRDWVKENADVLKRAASRL